MQEFTSKRDALFACLDDASKELKGTGLDQSKAKPYTIRAMERRHNARDDRGQVMNYRCGQRIQVDGETESEDGKLRRMRGKESIFKKPELPIGRCLKPRKTPDYQVNPHKWKKYSLSDVDISEQTNSAAALSFLREMDAQRETDTIGQDDDELASSTGHKIEFKKKSKLNRNLKKLQSDETEDVSVDKPQLRGSKLIMPEYVIGQRAAPKQKRSKPKAGQNRAAGTLQLSHLDELDEIDD
ncbi:uncharacterized protein Dwil_GK17414 [Drosophila willistoni]|uniref:U5 small nuclear ribonucleoprotein TSSC4 n=1 Tax=Drosophila willistoni TaxID=7260 RepID=B4MLX2_DROWI|nr:uncharacterized protein LOC6638915 [Drosophila willistoni]EDW73183.1 uncharacterized protein Dwil_GK17414 [Drosophila willistoni]